ncbi:hypothetical protein FI667_g11173, partial [Globisporangium splendens]
MASTTQRRSANADAMETRPVRTRHAASASKNVERSNKRVADREEIEAEDAVDDSECEEEHNEEDKSKHEENEGESRMRRSSRTMANADAFRLGASPADKKKQAALQRSILTGSYLAQAGANASELSRRLKQTWTVLQKMPNQHQEDESVPLERLQLLCSELMHERILAHNGENVRSLAACCFVELLRVYAPDMPFTSNEELYDAFQLIIEQIRNLAIEANDEGDEANTSCNAHYFHVLESLASTKSCSLLVGMEFTVEEGEEPLLVQLFKALFDAIRKGHSAKIENLMITITTACIEDSDMVEQPLLDVLLAPLVNASAGESEASSAQNSSLRDEVERGPYHMAQEVIRRSSDQLQSHLSHFFNSILVDAPSGLTAQKSSDLKEHVYTLIYEVHKINPSLLLYVLPNVCMQLQVDEVATRSEAIALMGRLFASSHADYGHQYMKNFRDFLGRFRDVSKEIRLQMVQVCAIIWQRKADLGSLIEKEFILRLSDPDWEVRRLVVNELCDLAANNLEVVSEECLRQTGERMKDKKVILRKETMTGLSQVYAAHISRHWSPEDGHEEEDELKHHNVPTVNSKKLGWVPDFVLKCFAYPQQELRLRVVQLLDDILLPKAASEVIRAKGLLFIFQALDPASKEALRRILSERAKCLQSCQEFILAKKQQRRLSKGLPSGLNSSAGLDSAKERLFNALSPLFPETTNLRKLLEQLSVWKDQTVFKHMESLCAFSKTQEEIRASRDRLIKSVGSKTPLGEFLKNLCRKWNLLTLNQATVSTFLYFFIQNGTVFAKENRDIVELLTMVSKITPEVFSPFIKEEFESILLAKQDEDETEDDEDESEDDDSDDKKDWRVIEGVLGVLANYSEYWKKQQSCVGGELDKADDNEIPSPMLSKQLEVYCWSPSAGSTSKQTSVLSAIEVHVSKLAARSIANFYGMTKQTSALIQKLSSKKRLASPESPWALPTLQSLLVFTKLCGRDLARNTVLVSTLWSSLLEGFVNDDGTTHPAAQRKNNKSKVTPAKLVENRCSAIKVAVNLLLHCQVDYESTEVKSRIQQVTSLLFDLLRSDGRKWTSNPGLAAKYRATAASSLLKLMRNRKIEGSVSVSEWHVLGFVVQDSSEEVRGCFINKLTSHLMKHAVPHPHKYLSYLALAASEPSMALKKKARSLLMTAVERMRRMFEASMARAGSDGVSAEAESLMVPEYSLPYVIHLLAHHPDFPKEAAESSVTLNVSIFHNPVWSEQLLHLSFFLDGLVSGNAAQADNIAFLLQILTKMSECDDVTSPQSTHIYPLIDTATLLLKKKIKNQSNLKTFPGRIYLPKQLYAKGGSKKPVASNPASSDANDVTSESMSFDLGDLTRKKGPRTMASLSPIKGHDIRDHFMQLSSPPASIKKRRSSAGTPASSRKSAKKRSLSSPASEKLSDTETPPRRQSLMRKARSQALAFADESSESGDDMDDVLPSTSVAARFSKKLSSDRLPQVQEYDEPQEE